MNDELSIKEFFTKVQKLKKGMESKDFSALPDINISALKQISSLTSYDLTVNQLRNPEKKLVWHVAMPKSGSTWVSNVIEEYLQESGWKSSWPHLPGDRAQEVSTSEFYRQSLLDDDVFICHMHTLGSQYNLELAKSFNAKILLQVRNIPDALVSLLDHFDKYEDLMPPVVYISKAIWNTYSQKQKVDFILNYAAPWYIRFWASWYDVFLKNQEIDLLVVKFEDLTSDSETTFNNIADFCEEECNGNRVFATPSFTRMNKGVKGRGNNLPDYFQERLSELTSFYPDVDFSYVGL